MLKRFILLTAALAIVASSALAVTGPLRAGVATGTTSGVKLSFNTITSGIAPNGPEYSAFVSCADDSFQVLAWKYNGSSFALLSPAAADTGAAGALANSFMRIDGKFDFLVVKTATGNASIAYQLYLNQ